MSKFIKHYSQHELSALSQQDLVSIVLQQQAVYPTLASCSSKTDILPKLAYEYDEFCRQVAKNFPNGVVAVLDRELNCLCVAGGALQTHGLTGAMLIGQPLEIVFSKEEAQRLRTEFQRVLQGEHFFTDTTVDEEIYSVSVSPLISAQGGIDRILAVSQNITERHRALRRVQESETQFHTLAESIPGAVYITSNDQNRDVLFISKEVMALTGYSAEDFKAKRITPPELINADDWKITKQALHEALEAKKPYRLTYRMKHRNGRYHWVEDYGTNIVKDGKQYFQGVLFDVSEKKQFEEELQKQNEDLKHTNAELDHFSYSVSHDLRAPLNSALGLLNLLKIEKDIIQRDEYVEMAEGCLRQLNNFIEEIITLSRNTRTELVIEEINLQKMVDEVISSQKQSADHNQVAIQSDIQSTAKLHTDRRRLRVILNNLLSNAIRYHRNGHDPSYVHISVAIEHQQAVLQVRDNGIGIEPKHKNKIFDMFYRATDRVSGSGLGLYLVKETVQKLRGHVEVDSQVNQGTTFTILLPSLA